MENKQLEKIAAKLDVSPNVVNAGNRALLHKLIYPVVQFGVLALTTLIDFLVVTIAGDSTKVTYPSDYYPAGLIIGTFLNGSTSTINFIGSVFLQDKLKVKRKGTIFLGTITTFLLSILIFLLIWREKVMQPLYFGATPLYGSFSTANDNSNKNSNIN